MGLGVLIGPDLLTLQRAPIGALFMLGAAISWAIGTILVKRIAWQVTKETDWTWFHAAVERVANEEWPPLKFP